MCEDGKMGPSDLSWPLGPTKVIDQRCLPAVLWYWGVFQCEANSDSSELVCIMSLWLSLPLYKIDSLFIWDWLFNTNLHQNLGVVSKILPVATGTYWATEILSCYFLLDISASLNSSVVFTLWACNFLPVVGTLVCSSLQLWQSTELCGLSTKTIMDTIHVKIKIKQRFFIIILLNYLRIQWYWRDIVGSGLVCYQAVVFGLVGIIIISFLNSKSRGQRIKSLLEESSCNSKLSVDKTGATV